MAFSRPPVRGGIEYPVYQRGFGFDMIGPGHQRKLICKKNGFGHRLSVVRYMTVLGNLQWTRYLDLRHRKAGVIKLVIGPRACVTSGSHPEIRVSHFLTFIHCTSML